MAKRLHMLAAALTLPIAGGVAGDVLHHSLLDAQDGAWFQLGPEVSMLGEEASAVYVLLAEGVSLGDGEQLIRDHGGAIRSRITSLNGLVVEMPRNSLAGLGREAGIRWIEPALPPLQPTNDGARDCANVDMVQQLPWGLDGDGVRVGLIEVNFPYPIHGDLAGRVNTYGSGAYGGHPTHVAGIMGGDGSESSGIYRGMAPAVTIDAHVVTGLMDYLFYTDPGTLESIYATQATLGGAAAMNQSMGINVGANEYPCWLLAEYGVTSALLDALVRGSQGTPIVSVWSAGNERAYDHCEELYGSVAPPACAKNIITVGSVYSNTSNITWFSGWGPTRDGRIKPDVVAPGSQIGGDGGITSCSSDGGYEVRSGTSMSAPVVTGLIALMEQALNEASGGTQQPLPSTIRMILCHTAEDRWQVGPDYRMGWGLVDAEAAVSELVIRNWIEAEVTSGEVFTRTMEVTPEQTSLPMKVTIAWDDIAASPGNDAGLVNDLDLMLQAPDGTLYYPWSLDPSDPEAPATRSGADRRNTIEQVVVDQPVAGTWNIIVLASQLQGGAQAFSMAVAPRQSTTVISFGPLPEHYPINEELEVTVRIEPYGEELVPGTAALAYRVNEGNFIEASLEPTGEQFMYRASLPVIACGSSVAFYAHVESTLTGVHTAPASGPDGPLEFVVDSEFVVTFLDTFDTDMGWEVDAQAIEGNWTRLVPAECTVASPPGSAIYKTGEEQGWFCTDLNGATGLTSPRLRLFDENPILSYWLMYVNTIPYPYVHDPLVTEFSIDDGVTWHVLEELYGDGSSIQSWEHRSFMLGEFDGYSPTDMFRLRFSYSTTWGSFYINEAGVDNVEIQDSGCAVADPTCPADVAGNDGLVNVEDLLYVLSGFGLDEPGADVDNDGDVDIEDLLAIINAWGACA